jgi:hypothetical protein
MNTLGQMLIEAVHSVATKPTKASARRKLTMAKANEMRSRYAKGERIAALAREYGINEAGARGIVSGLYYVEPDRSPLVPITRRVTWIAAQKQLPDSDIEVIVATKDGNVFAAFHDGEQWREWTSMPLADKYQVTHWCEFPDPPRMPA